MPRDTDELYALIAKATSGRMDFLRGDGTGNGDPVAGNRLLDAAVNSVAGTYVYYIPCRGNDGVTVVLKPTTLTGTVTASLAPVLADGVTPDPAASTAVTLTANTATKTSATGNGGARFAVLTIVIAAASSVGFAGGLAEYRAF